MLKTVIGLLTALTVAGLSLAYGQEPSSPMPTRQAPMPSPTDIKVLDRCANWHRQGGAATDA